MLLIGLPYFCFEAIIVGVNIDDAILIVSKVIIGLLGWIFRNKLINFLRC